MLVIAVACFRRPSQVPFGTRRLTSQASELPNRHHRTHRHKHATVCPACTGHAYGINSCADNFHHRERQPGSCKPICTRVDDLGVGYYSRSSNPTITSMHDADYPPKVQQLVRKIWPTILNLLSSTATHRCALNPTGHVEAPQKTHDPQQVEYGKLVDPLFSSHSFTTLNRTGNDVDTQKSSSSADYLQVV
ncbi:hypothetical protein WJX82_010888 [Trebouxia sp. C0006]